MFPWLSVSTPSAPVARHRRGLWKGRGTSQPRPGFDFHDDQRPPKRYRSEDTSDAESDDAYYIVEHSPDPSVDGEMEPAEPETRVEEWENLKELFSSAAEQYETDNINETLRLLRLALRECHRFLLLYPDPSQLYAEPRSKSPEPITLSASSPGPKKKCKCKESPTAFHAILGTTLFLFGNIVAQDSSLALPDEPNTPSTYWLAALDVFEMGENLPSRTSGRGCEAPEDWKKAVVWGRTLLCLADIALTLQQSPTAIQSLPPEPKWSSPSASLFAAVAMRRPPASGRISLTRDAPHDILLLAMDHFTRGIFHMPHILPAPAPNPTKPGHPPPFNRAAELLTIALEMLVLAERLPVPAERMRWATWADSVLHQIQTPTTDVARARGRCWLVVGTACAEDIEALAEVHGWDGAGVLDSEEAEEAREGLERAIGFFERSMSERAESIEGEDEELRAFFAESLITLANLTSEETKREALYGRAQRLGGVALEGVDMDET